MGIKQKQLVVIGLQTFLIEKVSRGAIFGVETIFVLPLLFTIIMREC